mgnify:CR=1 FL=1
MTRLLLVLCKQDCVAALVTSACYACLTVGDCVLLQLLKLVDRHLLLVHMLMAKQASHFLMLCIAYELAACSNRPCVIQRIVMYDGSLRGFAAQWCGEGTRRCSEEINKKQ